MAQTSGTPFIGRDDELARLTGVLDRARAGTPRAVVLSGDAGVGKTRVLTEAAAHATRTGMTVLTGHCVDLGDVGLPYLPFTEILGVLGADERFADALAAHPAVERLLGSGSGTDTDTGSRLRLFEGVAGLLADAADITPLLLVLEDLHWADQSSRDLLRFLLSRGVLQNPTPGSPTHHLALFASYRSDDLHRRHPLRPLLAELARLPSVDRLELRPMADAEVARLVRALRTDALSDTTVRRIVDRAEGNAFYAEELLAALPGDLDPAAPAMPSGLADLLLIRIEQLSDTAQQVLRTAAVAGRRVEHDLLRDAVQLPEEELESALREAVGRQLLVPGDDATYSFRHALAREAVYADLLPGERVRLHGAFAKLLAGRGHTAESAAERAHHSRESHDLADALTASLEAADHAHRVGAPAEELHHVEAALELWPAVDPGARPRKGDPVTLTLRASAAAAHAGETHRAVSLTRAALARAGSDADSELAARVRYTLAGNLMRVDSLKAAFTYSSEALAMIPAEPPSHTWVWAAATHVMAARYMGHDEDAERVARQALRTAEELRLADAQADLIISLVGLEDHNRRTAEGRERLRQARDLARRAGNVSVEMRALFNLAIGAYESGALDECLTWLAEGLERANRSGLVSSPYALELRYLQSLILYTLGRWDECARAATVDAERLPPAGGFAVGPALYVALARGEEGAAERARALLDGPFDWMATLVAGIVLTDAAALRGDPEGAVASVRATLASLSDGSGNGRPDIGVRLAALALSAVADAAVELRLTGDGAGARRWADLATELVEVARSTAAKGEDGSRQGPEGLAWLARAEAEWLRAHSGPEVAAWEQAVAAFDYGDPYELARCERRLAEALLVADRREEAAERARAARDTAVRLGAVPLREELDTLIRRGRLADSPSAADRVPALTARESDVLRLLARGRTNRQIGEELFITGKTASVHVSNILAKLGASGRTEAVAIAYREGLVEPPRDSRA
ncbi:MULTISPECIES: helix-turn-helix transcriptional regulator [unclassified Streptomyces]|uniref:helix-turn-helix transcriptional regulator n=1 Tax=unclassified Streptomyces TaxID=2593676 RepID=UPI00116504CA|nr:MULTISPECIES: helix-turn-helix transcriptional regulator [unclassified Streptomyces]QDN60309.1 AAA family ATPase [Streptomyces sp. S1D4-20]QDN70365.1 AAA family ATPase [Streptomyces sp. S1D4-14]QDO52819.1 AAA family ATPase [Streptomyces sp. RLB3-5]QDO63062.1 AAA family ATPase [Streptomyces sp. RLB1-8]